MGDYFFFFVFCPDRLQEAIPPKNTGCRNIFFADLFFYLKEPFRFGISTPKRSKTSSHC